MTAGAGCAMVSGGGGPGAAREERGGEMAEKSQEAEIRGVQLRQFVPSYESLGVVVDFLSRRMPFAASPLGSLLPAVKFQIEQRCHVCAMRGQVLVGYCGWLPITREMGEAWIARQQDLRPVPPSLATAAAVTVVQADTPAILRGVVRASRSMGPGRRLFFRRDYADAARPSRRTSVHNAGGAA